MSVIPIPFNQKSNYVKTILIKLKRENKFHIEDYEITMNIEDFFEELLNMVTEERKGRQGCNNANN